MEQRRYREAYRDCKLYGDWRIRTIPPCFDVALSDQFFGWVFGLGTGVKIMSPADVVEQFKDEIKAMGELYS